MITKELLLNLSKDNDIDLDFITNYNDYHYSDLLDLHRNIIELLELNFWIAEVSMGLDNVMTIFYVFTGDAMHILCEGLSRYNTLDEYVSDLNNLQEQSLTFNK